MIDKKNFDEWMIRSIENDLTVSEQAELKVFLQKHPKFRADAEAYNKTILIPDSSLVFSDKDSLKKPENEAKPIWLKPWFSASVAASVIALITLGFWLSIIFKSPRPGFTSNSKSTELYKGISYKSASPNGSIVPIKPSGTKKDKIATSAFTVPKYINHSTNNNLIQSNTTNTVRTPKENIAATVTYFTADTLQFIEANQIDEIIYIDKMTNKITAMDVPPSINNYNNRPPQRKGIKFIDGFLKRSGNTSLAKTFEKYDDLLDKKYEISYSSALLSLHKTFNSNQ